MTKQTKSQQLPEGWTQDDARRLLEKIASIIADTSNTVSQKSISKEIGVSSASISAILSGKYKGAIPPLLVKLRDWLKMYERRLHSGIVAEPDWLETQIAERIYNNLALAHMTQDISLIYGDPGLGKSKTIRAYADRTANVWVVTMTPTTNTVVKMLQAVASECAGVTAFNVSGNVLERRLVERFTGTKGLLVIDEAQHLRADAVDCLRSLYDLSDIGLVLCGNADVYKKLGGGSALAMFAQIRSRVGKRLMLSSAPATDAVTLARALGIDTAPELEYLKYVCRRPGALRSVFKCVQLASIYARGGDIAVSHLKQAYGDLAVGEAA